ncbi:hypothetical protein [Tunicatimonas pelagia]|uniref:hypothetical protein n=1 Tax=Tunicatimonas pelagia TaxID=931531 RepID=UPI0026669B02|nr:hypothetical protein [Tunicatimonas pelagia]WKN42327.1 hypothetical protein P0M28_25150 [Tunicatimonas pelagia]
MAIVPLFVTFPYRVNIFLSWEGAYRLYSGQVPYEDFGLPMGFMFWVVPAIFFKIFGPSLVTLVKAQVFVNIISGIAFSSILKTLKVEVGLKLAAVFLFCLSYSFFNFWPWYNHTVFVYQMIGMAFVLSAAFAVSQKRQLIYAVLGGVFATLSFFTKQDGGALAIMLCGVLLLYDAILEKRVSILLTFALSALATSALLVLPFLDDGFTYWFNYGQSPHTSRVSLSDIIDEFFLRSAWIKFYAVVIIILLLNRLNNKRNIFELLQNKRDMLFLLMTIGILVEASIVQVTSYTPPNNNIYFHSFAFVFIVSQVPLVFNLSQPKYLAPFIILILLWWSSTFYKYTKPIISRVMPTTETTSDVVNRHTYVINTDTSYTNIERAEWEFADHPVFNRIYMPPSTVKGIERIQQLEVLKNNESPKVLNMTELTPLARVLNYQLETNVPLWHHLNVSMFTREKDAFCEKIENSYYDVILFEDIPNLNNFFPYEVRNCFEGHYQLQDTFVAPRYPTNATIEVYIRNEELSPHK